MAILLRTGLEYCARVLIQRAATFFPEGRKYEIVKSRRCEALGLIDTVLHRFCASFPDSCGHICAALSGFSSSSLSRSRSGVIVDD